MMTCGHRGLPQRTEESYENKNKHFGSNCPIMDGFKLSPNNSISNLLIMTLPDCVQNCQGNSKCIGYNFNKTSNVCSLLDKFGRFVEEENMVSGRKCTNCLLMERTKVLIGQCQSRNMLFFRLLDQYWRLPLT